MLPKLPPELWECIIEHATYAPGTLVPDVYTYASHVGFGYNETPTRIRNALVTKRALVRVCKQWWHLAMPILYRSVLIRRANSLSLLARTLELSAEGSDILIPIRPLGEYTQRLDIIIYDSSQNPPFEVDSLALLIRHMPHLTIVALAMLDNWNVGFDFGDAVLDAFQHTAPSLHVLDWTTYQPTPPASRMIDFLDKCTQLRILNCPDLVWSKELEHGGIPPTVTTLRLRSLIEPVQIPEFDPNTYRRPGPSALQELILDIDGRVDYWKDLLCVYGSQLVSVQFHMPRNMPIDFNRHLQVLLGACSRLRRLIIIFPSFSFTPPLSNFPSITYLGLGVISGWKQKKYRKLFEFLEELQRRVPSLRVVRLLSEHHVECLLKKHTELAVRSLRSFMYAGRIRLEDKDGVLLTGLKVSHLVLYSD